MLLRAAKNNGLVGVALVLGDLAVVPGSFFGLAFCLPIDSLRLSSRLLWLLWQDSRAMYPPTIFLSRFDCFNRIIQNAMQLLAGQVCRHVPWGVFGPRKRD